jgi:tRNA(fMet)-specific endonuclease VapC
MGKNDLWIAATASFFELTLVTTDKDFHHLRDGYLKVLYIPLEDFTK